MKGRRAAGSGHGRGLVVVKLGGSLAQTKRFASWLKAFEGADRRLVLVPGGGPFADQVRDAQRKIGFDDATAHHLALLAMEQYGRALAATSPRLLPAASRAEIRRALGAGRIALWLPVAMALGQPEIPESWEVTSDSLALWLAGELNASDVVLVKSARLPRQARTADRLAGLGLVDTAFPAFLARLEPRCRVWYAGPADLGRLSRGLDGTGEPGRLIERNA